MHASLSAGSSDAVLVLLSGPHRWARAAGERHGGEAHVSFKSRSLSAPLANVLATSDAGIVMVCSELTLKEA
eukprot:scaffold92973_cov40-Prasinocladus_malaysianus.AAC.1